MVDGLRFAVYSLRYTAYYLLHLKSIKKECDKIGNNFVTSFGLSFSILSYLTTIFTILLGTTMTFTMFLPSVNF